MISWIQQRRRENNGYIGAPCEVTCDPFWDRCVFALPGQGANGSKPATDLLGNALTWVGAAAISTAQSPSGYGSGIYPGAGYVRATASTAQQVLGYDFTLRFKAYHTQVANAFIELGRPSSGQEPPFVLYLMSDGSSQAFFATSATSGTVIGVVNAPAGTIPASTIVDIEFSRLGTYTYFFLNGRLISVNTGVNIAAYTGIYGWQVGRADLTDAGIYVADMQAYVPVALHTTRFIMPTRDLIGRARRFPSGIYGL